MSKGWSPFIASTRGGGVVGRLIITVRLQCARREGEDAVLFSRSWRCSWASWCSGGGFGAVGNVRCPVALWRTSSSILAAAGHGREKGGVREVPGVVEIVCEQGGSKARTQAMGTGRGLCALVGVSMRTVTWSSSVGMSSTGSCAAPFGPGRV